MAFVSTHFVIAASDQQSEIWIQLLVFALIASAYGFYSVIKSRAKNNKSRFTPYTSAVNSIPQQVKPFAEIKVTKTQEALINKRNLTAGMEILDAAFLIDVAENTKYNNKKDNSLRSMCFNELIRRDRLYLIDSKTLKYYAINKTSKYDKSIQCNAIKELSIRTKQLDTANKDIKSKIIAIENSKPADQSLIKL